MSRLRPAVSVIMPVFNAEQYVAEAVESVLNQTFEDFEFLIVNDGSTDGSLEILNGYSVTDKRIRLISRPNTGLVVALNEMLNVSRGDLIARMDADDISERRRFSCQVSHLAENPDLALVGSAALTIDPEGEPLCKMWEVTEHDEMCAVFLRGETPICHPSVMFRKAILEKMGGPYRGEYFPAEDYEFFFRMSQVGKLSSLSEPLLKYRQHAASIGNLRRKEQLEAVWRGFTAVVHSWDNKPGDFPKFYQGNVNSQQQNIIKWGWWALAAGNLKTARKHARRSVAAAPFSVDSWRLLYYAHRGQ